MLPPRALERDCTTQIVQSVPTIEGFYDCLQNSCLVELLPDISNNRGPVKLFLRTVLHSLRGVVLFLFFIACIDDHGSLPLGLLKGPDINGRLGTRPSTESQKP
jgi:hypothetical protein